MARPACVGKPDSPRAMSNLVTLDVLAARLKRNERLMGVDLGTKTIGLALSDVERRLASPLQTIKRTRFAADAFAMVDLTGRFSVAGLVVGLPLNMDGSEGPRVQSTRAFVRNLVRHTDMPVAFWDERLSTAAVTRELIARDVSRAKRAAIVDQMAAAYILQGALDRIGRLAAERSPQ